MSVTQLSDLALPCAEQRVLARFPSVLATKLALDYCRFWQELWRVSQLLGLLSSYFPRRSGRFDDGLISLHVGRFHEYPTSSPL